MNASLRLLLLWIVALLGFTPAAQSWIVTNHCHSQLRCHTQGNAAGLWRHIDLLREPSHRQQGGGSISRRTVLSHNDQQQLVDNDDDTTSRRSLSRIVGARRFVALSTAVLFLLLVGPRLALASAVPSNVAAAVVASSAEPMVVASAPIVAEAAAAVAKTVSPNLQALCAGPALTMAMEIRLSLRLIFAALIGALVGWERSSSKHAAGVRTLSLVSMAAAAYTICSSFGFSGFARVDPSRMAANVASGVGFIGAGVITTSTIQQRQDDTIGGSKFLSPSNTVHGLTTAAAIWLSAAVGVACGVGLYFVATTAALTTIAILRLGRVNKPSLPNPRLIKTKSRKHQQQPGGPNPKTVGDGDTTPSQHARDLPIVRAADSRASSTLEYIDDEMELVVRSAWQNATENSSMFSKDDLSNFVPSRSTSSLHPEASP